MATTKIIPGVLDLNESTSESGLKIPSGTELNRPATDVAGMVRNNTNETSNGSASCEEYYNGTAWKKINNVALPVYFRTVTYTGNGTAQSITGVGFQPDLVWIKARNIGYDHALTDSTRGVTHPIYINTGAQLTNSTFITSFDSDGFSIGNNAVVNNNTNTYVAWCFKANGGTTSSNTDGDITSTVQVNSDAGFSITTYQNNGSNSARVGHGLGTTPKVVIIKKFSVSGAWHYMTTQLDGSFDDFILNNTTAKSDSGLTAPNSTTFAAESGGSGEDMICYAFAEVAGYSKFGTYAGSASNVNVVTGFQPSFVLVRSTGVEDWNIMDSARGGSERLFPNSSGLESTTTNACIFNSDGFTIGVTGNASLNNAGDNYIYMAFK